MCGIVGIVGKEAVAERLLDGLKRLEYRGYDSAGIATLDNGKLSVRRASGKLQALRDLVKSSPVTGNTGIGHTRWATHGSPTVDNAHPHSDKKVTVVHNGIIENHAILKERLLKLGYVFTSQTDTETVVHLLSYYLDQGLPPLEAFRKTLGDIEGAYALAILITGHDGLILVARNGSPLVVGHGEGENMVGSDALALSPWVRKIQYLDDGDYGVIRANSVEIYNSDHEIVHHPLRETEYTGEKISKGHYDHFMLKEIFEQPETLKETLRSFIDVEKGTLFGATTIPWSSISRLTIVACGTSYYAACVAKYWFEILVNLPVDVDIASEFRYRSPVLSEGGAALFISQSGETIDTLMALELAKEKKQRTIGLINARESSISRQADHVLYTLAGPEIGVASTKAFTAQLGVLACLVLEAAQERGVMTPKQVNDYLLELQDLPTILYQVLQNDKKFRDVAEILKEARDVLYLGRGTSYPIALEGALKLKEISYIHAEGCASGEIKHGPIALVDTKVPVVILAPNDRWMLKTLSNAQEVVARGAKNICFTDSKGKAKIQADHLEAVIVDMPNTSLLTAPIVYTIPMQLISYYTAVLRGTNVDQPRNLAKSVTVE